MLSFVSTYVVVKFPTVIIRCHKRGFLFGGKSNSSKTAPVSGIFLPSRHSDKEESFDVIFGIFTSVISAARLGRAIQRTDSTNLLFFPCMLFFTSKE